MAFASKNAFAALGDDDADAAPAVAKAPAAAAPTIGRDAPKAPRKEVPGLANNRAPRQPRADGGDATDMPQRDGRSQRGRGGRPERGARGGRGPATSNRGRARHGGFDRASGTGKEDSARRIEQGWGGEDPKKELEAENKAVADAADETPATPANESNGAAPEGEAPAPIPEEEKDNTKTLDEYLADLAAKRAQIGAKKEARQAETADANLGQRVERFAGEDYYASKGERTQRTRERKEKNILEIDQTFNQPAVTPRGGSRGAARGGRGGARGGARVARGMSERGGRGRGRGGANSNVNLADSSAFPKLG